MERMVLRAMGCDIHQRTFLWSKSIRHYVGVGEVTSYSSEYDIVGDRYYDLFGLFGNEVRSNYPPLDCLNFGIPNDLLPRTARLSFKHYSTDYHTFSWALLPNLYGSVKRYIEKLKDPAKFVLDDPESVNVALFDLPEWKEDTSRLLNAVEKISRSLGWLAEDEDRYSKIIDNSKTMFMFYFDN